MMVTDGSFFPAGFFDENLGDLPVDAVAEQEDAMPELDLEFPVLPESVWLRVVANALDPDAAPVADDIVPDPSTESLVDGSDTAFVYDDADQADDGSSGSSVDADDPDDGGTGSSHQPDHDGDHSADPDGGDQLGEFGGSHDFSSPDLSSAHFSGIELGGSDPGSPEFNAEFNGGDSDPDADTAPDHGWLS